MEYLKIIISGIIDGITGFIPVSSSGHIAVLRNTFGITADESALFDAFLKLAALLVIVFALKKDIKGVLKAVPRVLKVWLYNIITFFGNINKLEKEEYKYNSDHSYSKLLLMCLVGTIPTAIIGYASRDLVSLTNNTVIFPGLFLIITGVCLFITNDLAGGDVTPKSASYFGAFIIGLLQGVSAFPGLSRVGMVIAGCLVLHYDKKLTYKFSFLLAVPALIGVIAVDIIEMIKYGVNDFKLIPFYIIAAILAFVTGSLGIRIVHHSIKQGKYISYAIYCLVFGAFALAAMVVL